MRISMMCPHILREALHVCPFDFTGLCESLRLWNGHNVDPRAFCFHYIYNHRSSGS